MERYEDDIIAWLWRVYIETKGSDPFILPYLPMTKVKQFYSSFYFSSELAILKAAYNAIEITMVFLREKKIQPPLSFVMAGVSKVSHFC